MRVVAVSFAVVASLVVQSIALAASVAIDRPQSPRADQLATDPLDKAAQAGRLDADVLAAVRAGVSVSAILIYDTTLADQRAAERLARQGLTEESPALSALRAAEYDAVKRQVTLGTTRLRKSYAFFSLSAIEVSSEAELLALLSQPLVRGVSSDLRFTRTATDRAALEAALMAQSAPGHLALIRQPEAAAQGWRGAGVSVAILDTGIDYLHPDFGQCTAQALNTPQCKVAFAQDFAPQDNQRDDDGHGTNVAAIALKVAPDAKVLDLDVFHGSGAWSSDIIAALNWVVANRATYNIIAANMSLGSSSFHVAACANAYTSVFSSLRAAGVAPVVASGNGNGATFTNGIASPACTAGAVSVGAVNNSDQIASFSQSAPILTLLAPGVSVTAGGYTMSGTSMAAPHVAGAFAVLRSAAPTATLASLQSALVTTGNPRLDSRNNVTTPRIDVFAAGQELSGAGNPSPTPSPTPSPSPTPTMTTTPSPSPSPSPTPTITTTPSPPPSLAHNAFQNARVIAETVFVESGSTVGATTEPGEPLLCGVAPIGATVWYRVTVGASGRLTATTAGSQFDTTLALYRGSSLGTLTMVGCNDDASGQLTSNLAVALVPNETYYLQLGGYLGRSGAYTLRVTTTVAAGTPGPSPSPSPSVTPPPMPSSTPSPTIVPAPTGTPSPSPTPTRPPYQAPRPLPPGQGNGFILPPPPPTGVVTAPPIQTEAGPVVIAFDGATGSGAVSVSIQPIAAIVGPAPTGPVLSPLFQIQTTVAADQVQVCLPTPQNVPIGRPVVVLALVQFRWVDVTRRDTAHPGSLCATITPPPVRTAEVDFSSATTFQLLVAEQTEFPTHIPVAIRAQGVR